MKFKLENIKIQRDYLENQKIISSYDFKHKIREGDQTFCLLNRCEEYNPCDDDFIDPECACDVD